jgi:hypothetical protein
LTTTSMSTFGSAATSAWGQTYIYFVTLFFQLRRRCHKIVAGYCEE